MRDQKTALILLLILCFAVVSISKIEIVKAESTIYIRADGTVEGTDKITQQNGNIYTFTANIVGEIKVQRGNCVIDGVGYTLQGTWTGYDPNHYVYSKGIDLSNNRGPQPSRPTISNVTIKNLRIVNFLRGIEGVNSNNNTIINCYIADCGTGIHMPSNFLIANNTIKSGIFIDYTNADNIITQNNMIPEGVYEEYPAANLVGVFLAEQPTVYMNYWSDYNGTDADGDGIGDTPYIINEENQDNYPLMNPVEPTFIPEFPSWTPLLIMLVIVMVVAAVYRRRLRKHNKGKETVKRSAYLLFMLLLLSMALVAFANIGIVKAAGDYWTNLAPLPESVSRTRGAAAIDGKIYVIGWPTCEKYDPETNNWTTIASVPVSTGGAVVAYQNKIYLIGGNPTQVYDPVTDTWENRTSIPTTRSSLQANVVDGKIYLIGGQMPAGLYQIFPSSSNDVYDPETDFWSQMAPIPVPVMGYASAVLDDKIYIISGAHEGQPNYPPPTDLVQIFDPATNHWTNGTSIPTGVISARAVATTGLFAPKRIYVIGGTTTSYPRSATYNVIDLNQVYDPETDTWTTGTPMLTPRCSFAVAVVNDEIYAIGGIRDDNPLVVNEKYTPADYIPEFPSWTPLLITLVAVVAVAVVYRRGIHKNNQKER